MAMFNSYVKLPEGIYRMTMGQNLRHPIQNLPLDIFSSVVDFVATMFDPNYDLPLCQSAGWAPGEISGIHHPKKIGRLRWSKITLEKPWKMIIIKYDQHWKKTEKTWRPGDFLILAMKPDRRLAGIELLDSACLSWRVVNCLGLIHLLYIYIYTYRDTYTLYYIMFLWGFP